MDKIQKTKCFKKEFLPIASVLLCLLAAGCGIKPANVDPPPGVSPDPYPGVYPDPALDPK